MVLAAVATLALLTLAVAAGLASPAGGGGPVIFVNRVASRIDEAIRGVGDSFWWTYAFLLGAVAAFNPCGFALLPAYLGLYLGDDARRRSSLASRIRRSLAVAGTVATAFTVLFAATGALFAAASAPIVGALPWAGLIVGVVLILVGGASLAGRPIGLGLSERVAGSLGRDANMPGARGYAVFGLAYGVASLGCTLPLFLALIGTAVASAGAWAAALAFALYGAGMAVTLGTITIVAGIASFGILSRIRPLTRFVSIASSALLLIAGAFVVYYWLSAGRLLLA